jgi:hypothetical protein
MIVSPDCIELWYVIQELHFELELWQNLSQEEKNWLTELTQKLKIENKKLNNQQNKECSKLVERLQLLEGGMHAGNDAPELKKEFLTILDELKKRRALESWTVESFRRRLT